MSTIPALCPRDECASVPVTPHLNLTASTQNPKHTRQPGTHPCIRTALELLGNTSRQFAVDVSARALDPRDARRAMCLPISERATASRRTSRRLRLPATRFRNINNLTTEQNPVSRIFKLKSHTTIIRNTLTSPTANQGGTRS